MSWSWQGVSFAWWRYLVVLIGGLCLSLLCQSASFASEPLNNAEPSYLDRKSVV